ncbi:hypothetical protein HGB07_02260 [Candidatus Roizmanbacteria bacterium]|nr:hypothetical protein [Candidatus Roizmanbacteria bacterium]
MTCEFSSSTYKEKLIASRAQEIKTYLDTLGDDRPLTIQTILFDNMSSLFTGLMHVLTQDDKNVGRGRASESAELVRVKQAARSHPHLMDVLWEEVSNVNQVVLLDAIAKQAKQTDRKPLSLVDTFYVAVKTQEKIDSAKIHATEAGDNNQPGLVSSAMKVLANRYRNQVLAECGSPPYLKAESKTHGTIYSVKHP